MATYGESNAECLVFTRKEGLLAKAAHDLTLCVERFEIDVNEAYQAVEATFDTRSLRLVSARFEGREEDLPPRDIKKIHDHIVKDVLHPARFPEARFVSSSVEAHDAGFRVRGWMTLHGQTEPLEAEIRAEDDRWVTEVELCQPDFGIKPFVALFRTIRIQPNVRVRVSVPKE